MWRYIVSLIILASSITTEAQFDPRPKAIRFGTDLTNIGYTIFANDWNQLEFNADLEIANFFIVGDYGVFDRT